MFKVRASEEASGPGADAVLMTSEDLSQSSALRDIPNCTASDQPVENVDPDKTRKQVTAHEPANHEGTPEAGGETREGRSVQRH